MKLRQWLRDRVKYLFCLYDIEEFQAGGWCGCCGKWRPNVVVPEWWPYTVCPDCESKRWIDSCLRCGKPMRVTHTGNHYCQNCQKCRRSRKFNIGRGYPAWFDRWSDEAICNTNQK